jgi:outer membrane protein TolC
MGILTTELTASPDSQFAVQDIDELQIPASLPQDGRQLIELALKERPDLLQQLSLIDAAKADISAAKSRYYPAVTFNKNLGQIRAYGLQLPNPATYAPGTIYDAQLTLSWNVFDGGNRRSRVHEAKAGEKREQDAYRSLQDKVESEVWQTYIDAQTAFRQRDAASALLHAPQDSYDQSLESYKYGVRNIVDVLATERQLAQARYEDVAARIAVLDSLAQVTYRTGALLRTQRASHP